MEFAPDNQVVATNVSIASKWSLSGCWPQKGRFASLGIFGSGFPRAARFFNFKVDYLRSFATFAHSLAKGSKRVRREQEEFWTRIAVTTKKKEVKKPGGKSNGPATAASILGQAAFGKPGMRIGEIKIKPEWQIFYDRLIELRDQLTRQMTGLAKESAQEMAGYSLHMADSGTDNFDRDFALSLLSSDQDAIYEIEEALKRIEKNTYGVCELTAKPIPRTRLEAIPWTRFTVQAQAQLERDGALRQRRLGALGSVDAVGVSDNESEEDEPEEKPKEKE
jgi:RNA polymerase-binding transcription factor DksA